MTRNQTEVDVRKTDEDGKVSRRRALGALAATLAGGTLLSAEDDTRLEVGGAVIEVSVEAANFDIPQADLLTWVKGCAQAVTAYYGRFPVRQARVRISPSRRDHGVSNGRSFGENGAMCRISVGQHVSLRELQRDWMLTHEMVHFGFPSVEDDHHWIEEGTATYVEPIARVLVGNLTPEQVWSDVVRDIHQGLPEAGDQGLDNTHTWGRTYWGGALFCLMADINIRKQSSNRKGFRDAMIAINKAGGTIDVDWPLTKAFEIGDKATGGKELMKLYEQMRAKPVPVDLPALWRELGISRQDNTVTFDAKAPLASIRAAIA
jgi:hypothetical protein